MARRKTKSRRRQAKQTFCERADDYCPTERWRSAGYGAPRLPPPRGAGRAKRDQTMILVGLAIAAVVLLRKSGESSGSSSAEAGPLMKPAGGPRMLPSGQFSLPFDQPTAKETTP